MRLMTLALAAISGTLLTRGAHAGPITQSVFTNTAVISDLNNLAIPNPGNVAAPLTVGIFTFTTDDGQLRYANFGSNNSPALGNNTDLGFINISLATGVTRFGFDVGLAGPAQSNSETVSFFDTSDILLGTIAISSAGGFTFVGFDAGSGLIGRALITDTDANSSVVTIDNLEVQNIPEPPTVILLLSGLAALAGTMRCQPRARKAEKGA